MGEIVKWLLDLFKSTPAANGLSGAVRWMLKGSPVVLRAFTVLFLFISILLGFVVWQDIAGTNEVMMRALSSPLEGVPHPSSAMEVLFLASILQPQPATSESGGSNGPPPNSTFSTFLQAFQQDIENAAKHLDPGGTGSIRLDVLNGAGVTDLSTRVLTDQKAGFLFVPGAYIDQTGWLSEETVGNRRSASQPSAQGDEPTFQLQEARNLQIYTDIILAQSLADDLCGPSSLKYSSGGETLFTEQGSPIKPQLQQAYVIFRTGVMRVCETKQNSPTDWKTQRNYYIDKFSPETRLEQKPYFQQTLNSSNGYYLTGPYIDLGGNGVIRTYCKHLQTKTHNPKDKDTSRDEPEDAVLCLDFPLATPIGDSVASAVARFGGAAARAQCDGLNCTLKDGPVGEPSFAERFKAFFYPSVKVNYDDSRDLSGRLAAAANQHQQANLTGQVTMLPSSSKPGLIRLAVPTEPGQILLVKIDLAAYQWWRSFWLSLAAGSAATTVLLFLLMFADYGLKLKEQERAFNAVDTIMSDVPAPYARVGEDGKFIKCNTAFANLLGYDSVEHAMPQLRNHLYEDYLDKEGKEIYNAVKEERREGKDYRSYIVKLYTGGGPGLGPLVSVRVHGGDVPTPHLARKQPGQSFGIILRTEEPGPVAVKGHRTAERAIVDISAPAGH